MLEPAHCFPHQLWRAAQIPLRIGDVDMAEVGGQDRQATFWVLIGLIPAYERIRGKYVPHIVETWPVVSGGVNFV